jgi:hypothetical protein
MLVYDALTFVLFWADFELRVLFDGWCVMMLMSFLLYGVLRAGFWAHHVATVRRELVVLPDLLSSQI